MQLQLGKSSGKEQTIFERPVNKRVLLVENYFPYMYVRNIIIPFGLRLNQDNVSLEYCCLHHFLHK